MPRALVIADDLTGATDTAHAFAKRGHDTTVQVDPHAFAPDATVLAVNTASRYADPETASERIAAVVSRTDAAIVYNKVDSTLRGNVVPEIDAVMSCGFDYGVFAPAAPALGRTTAAGYQLVDGALLSTTEYAMDSNGPVSSHLPTLIGPLDHSVSHLDVGTTATDADTVREAILANPPNSVLVCDGTHSRHLEAVAGACERIDQRVAYIGSAGLAEHVAVPAGAHGSPASIEPGDNGALGVIGSTSESSLSQLEAIPDDWIVELESDLLVSDPERAGTIAGKRAGSRIETGEPAVVTAAVNNDSVERTLRAGDRSGIESEAVRSRVATALASGAETAFAGVPGGLFVTGGETAMSVFERLNVTSLSLSGEAIEAGIPVSRLQGGPAAGTTVVTKAGGFGTRSTAIDCLRFLERTDESPRER